MTGQPELWLPAEQAYTREPPRTVETRYGHGLDHPDDEPRIIPGDHGQPPGRPRDLEPRVIHNLATGDLL